MYEVYSAATLLDKIVERLVEEARDEAMAAARAEIDGSEPGDSRFEAMAALLSDGKTVDG